MATRGQAAIDAAIDDILDLGDLSPETKPVKIIRDGKPVTLQGWFDGDGCLVSVQIEVAGARKRYRKAIGYGTDAVEYDDAAYLTFCREMIHAAVPDLTVTEVEAIAASEKRRTALLEYLGWFQPTPVIAEDDAVPEVSGGVESTTASSSPDSAASIPAIA